MDSARALTLARMGIDRYVLRTPPGSGTGVTAPGSAMQPAQAADEPPASQPFPPTRAAGAAQAAGVREAGPASAQATSRSAPLPADAPAPAMPMSPPHAPAAPPSADASAAWDALIADIGACRACGLCESRTQTVPGVGDRNARWLVVGEAPGQEEDLRGEPFVGRAGKLLDAMLYAVGLDRGNCYIANILKCRPPANRNPTPEEAALCRPFLDRQLTLIAPRLILAVGAVPARYLLQTELAVGKLRGQIHRLPGTDIPLVVTYHPAYLLRSPLEKRKVWDDLCLARDAMSPT